MARMFRPAARTRPGRRPGRPGRPGLAAGRSNERAKRRVVEHIRAWMCGEPDGFAVNRRSASSCSRRSRACRSGSSLPETAEDRLARCGPGFSSRAAGGLRRSCIRGSRRIRRLRLERATGACRYTSLRFAGEGRTAAARAAAKARRSRKRCGAAEGLMRRPRAEGGRRSLRRRSSRRWPGDWR